MHQPIVLYGADWCGDCHRSRRLLDRLGVGYEYIDVEIQAGAAEKAVEVAGGRKNIPVIVFPDGRVLVEPSDPELESALS
jgi:mycoredoxin